MRSVSVMLMLMLAAACDRASLSVDVHRPETADQVEVRACRDSCAPVDVFANAPDALERSVGFFVHTAPQTLTLEWSVAGPTASRCDTFTVPYVGTALAFDVAVSPGAAPSVTGCASCGAPVPCTRDGGTGGGTGAGGGNAQGGGSASGGGSATGGGASGGGIAAGGGASTGGGASGGGSAAGGGASAGGGTSTGGGSSGGGSAAGGGASAGGGVSTGGGSAGGGTAAGGGDGFTGDGGALQWTTMTVSGHPHGCTGVRAFSARDAWATITDNSGGPTSLVVYFDGGTGSGGGAWVPAFGNPSSDLFTDVELIRPSQRIAAVLDTGVFECDRSTLGCVTDSDWQSYPLQDTGAHLNKLCTDGKRFFATGLTAGVEGGLYARSGGSYVQLASFPGTSTLNDCDALADGTIVAVGTGRLAMYFTDGGSAVLPVQSVSFDATSVTWYAVHRAGGRTFLAGDDRRIVELLPDAGFDDIFDQGSLLPSLHALGGLYIEELYAAGTDSMTFDTVRFDGSSWSDSPPLGSFLNVLSLVGADSNTFFACGQQLNGSGGIVGGFILRGHR